MVKVGPEYDNLIKIEHFLQDRATAVIFLFVSSDCVFFLLRFSLSLLGNHFPRSFEKFVRKIHRLLLHVLAHIYQCHCREMAALGLLSHLNTVTFHFLLFNRRFNLLENKETNVLGDLFERLHSNQRREDIQLNLQNFSVLRDFESSASTSASLLHKSGVNPYQDIRPLAAKENDSSAFICDNIATCGLVA